MSQNSNNDKCQCKCKNLNEHPVCEKDYIWNPATCTCENGKHLGSIYEVITCDKIINVADNVSINVRTNVVSTASTNTTSTVNKFLLQKSKK